MLRGVVAVGKWHLPKKHVAVVGGTQILRSKNRAFCGRSKFPGGRGDGRRALFDLSFSGPPKAERGVGEDPYEWLRTGNERDIRRYLEKENKYAERMLKGGKRFEKVLVQEMSQRLAEAEEGIPELIEGWYFYARTEEGSSFPIYCR